jgi:hypothetical protein
LSVTAGNANAVRQSGLGLPTCADRGATGAARYGRGVPSKIPTVDELYDSAVGFAAGAMAAHATGARRRLAVDAVTSLEHLLKACLIFRSPVLVVNLSGEGNWSALRFLAGLPDPPIDSLRTVGVREALRRTNTFFTSAATTSDVNLLFDLRDGVVHAGFDQAVEERLLVAFIKQADSCLLDLGRERTAFWGNQLAVADALVVDATDKARQRVEIKLGAARARFVEKLGELSSEVQAAVRLVSPGATDVDEMEHECPACGSVGVATGVHRVVDDYEVGRDGVVEGTSWAVFRPESFACGVCGLRLTSSDEIELANMDTEWDSPLDPLDIGYDDDYVDYRDYMETEVP